jgi:hypothetical protein
MTARKFTCQTGPYGGNKMIGNRRLLWYPAGLLGCILVAWSSASAQPHRAGASASKPASSPTAKATPNKAGTTTLYLGLFNGQDVNVYDAFGNGQPTGQILDGLANTTGGLAVGHNHRLYVSDATYVTAYPRGGLVPLARYRFPDQGLPGIPLGIAVGTDGTLYAPLSNDGVVAVYPKGDTMKASLTIPAPSGNTVFAVALDNQNNLYIEYGAPTYPSAGYIEVCLPNSTQCTDLGITLGAPGYNLVVDLQGNIIACDELAATIDVFPPGSNQPRIISQGLNGCPFFALDKQQDRLFVANQNHGGTTQGVVSVFDYASGTLVNTISGGIPSGDLVIGVALDPSLR